MTLKIEMLIKFGVSMREIRFRAWHEQGKEMVYFKNEKLVNDQYQMQHLAHLMNGDYGDVLMQYTGLKDKNGVEIYEGDIVDCYWLAELGFCEIDCQHKGVVRFVDCRFEVSFSDKAFIRNIGEDGVYSATELELTCMSHDDDYAVEYEVIGNIYENPELIQK